jgi:hypothetical protein
VEFGVGYCEMWIEKVTTWRNRRAAYTWRVLVECVVRNVKLPLLGKTTDELETACSPNVIFGHDR